MIGYHFTTWDNWQSIQHEGLTPGRILPHLEQEFRQDDWPVHASFIWRFPFEGINLACQAMDRAMAHHCLRIIYLKVQFGRDDILRPGWQWIHTGTVGTNTSPKGEWTFHKDEPFWLVDKVIHPESIEMIGDFDFLQMVRDGLIKNDKELELTEC